MDQERSWSDLPEGILGFILTHLVANDLDEAEMVCKSWRSAILALPKRALPLMDVCEDDNNQVKCRFYHPAYKADPTSFMDTPGQLQDYKYTYNLPYPPELHNTEILSSNFGWLLVRTFDGELADDGEPANDRYDDLSFFNPITCDHILLPLLDNLYAGVYCFSSPPSSSDCTVISLDRGFNGPCRISIIKRGEQEWTINESTDGREINPSCECNPVFFDGRCYFLEKKGRIGVYDVEANNWNVFGRRLKHLRRLGMGRPITMAEDDGGMLVVVESYEHDQLHVSRFDLLKMEWEEVESLGDNRALFVSRWASHWENRFTPETGNKIYFTKFHQGNMVYYSLATKRYHSFDGSYSSHGPYKLTEPWSCTWFRPTHFSEDIVGEW